MRLPLPPLLVGAALLLGACGHVAGNYPEPRSAPEPAPLPESFRLGNIKGDLVWQEAGRIHGFLMLWEHASVSTERLHQYAIQGNAVARRDEDRFRAMADRDLACAAVWVFVAPGFHRAIRPEQVRLEFEDGSSAPAEELFLYNPPRTEQPVQSSVSGTITLRAEDDPDHSGRYLYCFFPAEQLGMKLARVVQLEG